MTAARHLRVIDGDGEVLELEDAATENKALRAALTRSENVIKGLKAQMAAERQKTRKVYPVDDAFKDWRDKLVDAGRKGMRRAKLSDDRIDAIGKMFEAGYTLEDFALVSTGISEFQFIVYGKRRQQGAEDARNVDIAYVCEKARRFEEAARLGAIVEKARQA
jgi:hypothetical protein